MLRRPEAAVEYCLKRAAEAEQLAALANRISDEEYFRKIASGWRYLAKDTEFIEMLGRRLSQGEAS